MPIESLSVSAAILIEDNQDLLLTGTLVILQL